VRVMIEKGGGGGGENGAENKEESWGRGDTTNWEKVYKAVRKTIIESFTPLQLPRVSKPEHRSKQAHRKKKGVPLPYRIVNVKGLSSS